LSTLNPGTTGYDVYLANMGSFSFAGCQATTPCGSFALVNIGGLPVGSVLYAFSMNGAPVTVGGGPSAVTYAAGTAVKDTTAPSSSIITPIPEPGTLVLFGTGICGLAGLLRRRLVG